MLIALKTNLGKHLTINNLLNRKIKTIQIVFA